MIRRLEMKDAVYMHEWMKDENVVQYLRQNFREITLEKCYEFIENCTNDNDNIHMAIINECDEYMGTISLKNIDMQRRCAEFAIVIRQKAMGGGYSGAAMRELFEYAHRELGLECVYWYVAKDNDRAIRFYNKNGYKRVEFEEIKQRCGIILNDSERYLWYIEK